MIFALLMACASEGIQTGVAPVKPPPDLSEEQTAWSFSVAPELLNFGDQLVDVTTSQTVEVTNTGESDLLLLDVEAPPDAGLDIGPISSVMLSPGASTPFDISWTPAAVGQMNARVTVLAGPSQDLSDVRVLQVSGAGQGPVMQMSTAEHDFGELYIGCEERITLTVSNSGTEMLRVDRLDMEGDDAFTLLTADDGSDDLPWALGPFQSKQFSVVYTPNQKLRTQSVLEIGAGDLTASTVFTGEGTVEGEFNLSYTVGEANRSTMLVHINEVVIPGDNYDWYSDRLLASLPTFFQTLNDNHASYRIAFLWSTSGTVSGPVPYIDETFSPDDATDAAVAMFTPGANMGDNDSSFVTLANGVTQNSDWLFEDSSWDESKLSFITVNRDQEQSGGSYTTYLAQAQTLKDDPADIIFHAIAGPPPSGCDGGSVEYFTGYWDAVNATGGTFLSMCEADWTAHMEQIAAASMNGAAFFPLSGTPLVSSIQVWVDEGEVDEGWEYDESLNAVVFDADAYPDQESVVDIYFQTSTTCL